MKTCSKCGWMGELSGFHRDPKRPDGHREICKPCACAVARRARDAKLDYWREHDRIRAKTPERKRSAADMQRKVAARFPEKIHANKMINRAIAAGRLEKQPCSICGATQADAHHDDYSKPFDVRWLCRTHHAEHHRRERALARQRQGVHV